MSPITDEILERYWDNLLPVKVDDIASRLGVTIRPLEEDLCKDYSGLAFIEAQQEISSFTIINVSRLTGNVLL